MKKFFDKKRLAKEILAIASIILITIIFYAILILRNNYYINYKQPLLTEELTKISNEKNNIPNRTEVFYGKMKNEFYYRVYKHREKIVKARGKKFTFDGEVTDEDIAEAIDDYFSGKCVEASPKFNYTEDSKKERSTVQIPYSENLIFKNVKLDELEKYKNENWKLVEPESLFEGCIFYGVSFEKFQELLQTDHYRRNIYNCYIQNTLYAEFETSVTEEFKFKEKFKSDLKKINLKYNSLEKKLNEIKNEVLSTEDITYFLSRFFIALLIILYPVRGFYFLIQWSIRVLKSNVN